MHVIGTAGHIDHGKSTLVQALTGINPDRLIEEQRRGMTIELGFAWVRLPSGREASVVDVPGHERFIRHMLAGAGGVDVALLVVAADEGVMPQTREHLDILDLLGVSRGVVALTKSDLVDDEWLALVQEDVRDTIARTTLRDAELIPVSATTGAGLDALRAALDHALDAAPPHADRARPHLPVDRVFTLTGFGTIVTGTLLDGSFGVGQDVEIAPRASRARIRGLQAHKTTLARALPGGRVAVNLAGVSTEDVARGDVLTLPGLLPPASLLDVRLRAVGDLAAPLTHNMPVTVHTGAAEVAAKLSLLDHDVLGPGDVGWVQLRLAEPIAAGRGDRVVVRRPSPSATLAGGMVVDARPARHRRFVASVLRHLETLGAGTPQEKVQDALAGSVFRSTAEVAARADLSVDEAAATLAMLRDAAMLHQTNALWSSISTWADVVATVGALLTSYHERYPWRRGLSNEELRGRLKLPSEVWGEVARSLEDEAVVKLRGDVVSLNDHTPHLSADQEERSSPVRAALAAEPYAPPTLGDIAGVDAALLEALVESRDIILIAPGLYLAHAAYDAMVAAVLEIIDTEGAVTVAALRDRFGTSRKYALALLEHLDDERMTRRVGDNRVRGPKARLADKSPRT